MSRIGQYIVDLEPEELEQLQKKWALNYEENQDE